MWEDNAGRYELTEDNEKTISVIAQNHKRRKRTEKETSTNCLQKLVMEIGLGFRVWGLGFSFFFFGKKLYHTP